MKERHILQALRGRDFAEEKKQAAGRGPDTILSARKRPEGASSEVGSFLSKQLLGPQAAGISLLQTLDASMGILMSKGLDAKLEYEADGQGAALAATAGYDGAALGRYFARLRSRTPGAPSAAVEKTHPTFLDRERTLVTFLRGNAALATTGASGAERFLRVRKRLVALKVPVK